MKRKLAILRARHDTSMAPISDRACIEMMMANPNGHAVLQFWETVTDGYLDFVDSVLFPWVDIAIDSSDVTRDTQCARAYEATKARNGGELDGFDGFVVLTWPGQIVVPNPMAGQPGQAATVTVPFDGGAGGGLRGKGACAIPVMTSNHTFMCHEVGHVLGFEHSYGVLNNGTDWDGKAPFTQGEVYGDPYDLMSSASFGARWLDPAVSHYSADPGFAGPAVAGWPNPNAFYMGPAPARAHVHLWNAEALRPQHVQHHPIPAAGGRLSLRLVAALGPQGGVQLAVLHPIGEDAEGRGRLYIEYRQRGGWDLGLDVFGTDLARQGVVVHALADTSEGVRCWYRGRILVPRELDSDRMIKGTPLVVQVTGSSEADGWVDIDVSTGQGRGVELLTRNRDDIIAFTNPQPMSTPCGDPITHGTLITQTQSMYQPVSYGFAGEGAPDAAPLKASWTVGGVAIAGNSGSIDAPTTDGTFTIQYALDPITAELSLTSRGGERYRVDAVCTMTEADGSGAATAVVAFSPPGWHDGYSPEDGTKLARCLDKYARRARLRLRDILIPPGPGPVERERIDVLNRVRLDQAVSQVAVAHPASASAISAIRSMRYGVGR